MKKIIILLIFLTALLLQPCHAFNKVDQQVQIKDSLNYKLVDNQIKILESGFLSSNHLKSGIVNINLSDSTHLYEFNTSRDSVLKERTLFTYDNAGRIKTELQYKWNHKLKRWLDFKYVNTYDRSGKMTLKNYTGWYIEQYIGDWYITNFHYKDTTIAFPWTMPYYYDYNKEGKPSLIWRFTFDQYHTPIATSYNCHYDSNGNKTSVEIVDGKYSPYLEEYSYDSTKTLVTVTQSRFLQYNYISLLFCSSKIKYEYAYDSDNRVSNIQSYYFSFKANEWKYVSKVTYSYGDKGLLETRIYSILDTIRNEPVQADKAEYFYNNLNNIALKLESPWDKVDNQWKTAQKEYYYYTNPSGTKGAGTTEINIKEELPLRIFPNPAKEMLWIENTGNFAAPIQICNVNGQCVKTVLIEKGMNTINLFPLTKGIYFIKIFLLKEMKSSKLIID